jgi:hypothetical protein
VEVLSNIEEAFENENGIRRWLMSAELNPINLNADADLRASVATSFPHAILSATPMSMG